MKSTLMKNSGLMLKRTYESFHTPDLLASYHFSLTSSCLEQSSAKMSDYIPIVLISNIISRLPVEDVLRCTSVCKSWYSLITSRSFASSHLSFTSDKEPRMLVEYFKNGNVGYCLRSDNRTFEEIAELYPPRSDKWGWTVIGCFNGLFCLQHNRDQSGRMMLWNPYIRKSFLLPDSRVLFKHETTGFGFAYLPASNDYKIVRFSCASKTQPQAQIFQLSTGSWRDLEFKDYSYAEITHPQAHLNGVLHWWARDLRNSNLICSFDMKTEKFGALMVPSCLASDTNAYFLPCLMVPFGESLGLIDDNDYTTCVMWIMKDYGVADSWEKLFVIDRNNQGLNSFRYLKHNGEIFFGRGFRSSAGKTELVYYDWNTNQIKNVPFFDDSVFSMHAYAESLVLIKSPYKVMIDEESRFDAETNVQAFSSCAAL